MKITNQDAATLINGTDGKVFSVKFVTRGSGEVREGRFRLGSTVTVGRAGGEAAYSFSGKGLISVYRMAGDESTSDGQWRTIPIEGIKWIKINGVEYEVGQ